jgi:integral membrane protein
MNGTPKSIFGTFALIEMITWGLLIIGLVARETIGIAPNLFFIAGATHGFAFIGYSATAVLVAVNQRWPLLRGLAAVMLAIVPFATVPFEKYLEKRQLLEGNWRREKSKNPSDNTKFDQLFRWFINHPVVLVLTLVVVVFGLFTFLLWLGPPSEWGK